MKQGKVFFVRHGESEANTKGMFAGQRENSPLTKKGREQAKQVAFDLLSKEIKPQRVIVSPLIRSYETAQIIIHHAKLKDAKIMVEKRIAEYDMGSLTGTPYRKITSKELVAAENAEDPQKFMDRLHSLLEEIINTNEIILIVSHAGVGRIIETNKKGLPASTFYDLDPFPNAQVIEL